jgi:membrane protein DedA with SNARE-associated domain
MDAITNWITQYGCIAVFSLLMLGIVGLPVPDEVLLTFVGYLIFSKILHPVPAAAAAFLGSVCGITLSYFLGRTFGLPLIERYGRFINLKMKHLEKVRRWFNRLGKWTLTGGYFFPGVRHFTGFVAGTSKLQWRVFAGYAYLGALFWVATFISLGYFLGEEWPLISAGWLHISQEVHALALIVGLLTLIILAGYLFLRPRLWQKAVSPVPVAPLRSTGPFDAKLPR